MNLHIFDSKLVRLLKYQNNFHMKQTRNLNTENVGNDTLLRIWDVVTHTTTFRALSQSDIVVVVVVITFCCDTIQQLNMMILLNRSCDVVSFYVQPETMKNDVTIVWHPWLPHSIWEKLTPFCMSLTSLISDPFKNTRHKLTFTVQNQFLPNFGNLFKNNLAAKVQHKVRDWGNTKLGYFIPWQV